MPETPDDPYALYEAYHHAEKLLDAGTAEQSVIFTLMGRGMSHDQAVEIVNDLAGARVKRPQRFRTKTDVAAARHAAKETMLFGLANCGTGLIVGLVVTLFVVHTDWVAFIGYLFAGWRAVVGGSQIVNGGIDYIMGWEPLKRAPRSKIDRRRRLF